MKMKKKALSSRDYSRDIEILDDMSKFITIMNELDNTNGTKLRYSKDRQGNVSQNTAVFVNLQQIYDTVVSFIKQLKLFS